MKLIIDTEKKTIHCLESESLDAFKKEARNFNIDLTEYSYLRMKSKNEMKKTYKVKKDEIKSKKKGLWILKPFKWLK